MRWIFISIFLAAALSTVLPAKPADDETVKLMSMAGIKSASEIDSIIISFYRRGTYKVTYKDNPEYIKQVYDSLQSVYDVGPLSLGAVPLILNLQNGKTLWVSINPEPFDKPMRVFVAPKYSATSLLKPLEKIRTDAKAAVLDSRIGEFEVDYIEAKLPRGDYINRISPSSELGKALLEKAKAIIDCVDLRNTRSRPVSDMDVSSANAKFGMVNIFLKERIQLELQVWDEATAPRGLQPEPFGHNISFKKLPFNKISVLDYGNYLPPLVALTDWARSSTYYLCPTLTRREQEKYGVEKLGLPGHPLSDTEYYKSPETLYNELQAILKTAAAKQNEHKSPETAK